ncbi:MAG: hypothetical protein H7Z39_20840, partial [Burkholderiaceae bacterium]|nr:hypothetical protein [Burkholderiaceae bacterium]
MLASAAASGALVKFDGGPVAGCSLSGKTYTNCAASVFNAANDFEVGSSHIVYADIVGDSVKLGSSSEVHGNITATAVELNSHSEVFGNISASDLVTLGSNSSITGSVVAGNSISLSSHSDITGNVSATNVTLANNTTITGNVTAITVISSGNIGGTTTCSTFNGATNPCAVAGPHHYELSMPSTGINCLPNTVTVTACANSSSPCTSRSTTLNGKQATLGASTGGLLSSTAVTFDGAGVATATLSYPSVSGPVTVTLSGEQIAAANARTCCPNGAACSTSNSCSATFDTSGFIFSSVSGATGNLANQVAGTASGSQYLRAVKSDNTTMACGAALVGTQAVSLAYECKDPTACSGSNLMLVNSTTIARNDNAASTTYLPVNLTFDANGNAPFIIRFDDVGQVILRARKIMPNSAVLNGFSNPFIVKPGGFVLSAIKQTASPFFANPAADLAFDPALPRTRDTAFVRAGEAFSVTATATTSGGAATPNFGKETTPEGVQLLVSAANDPAFSAPFADMLNLPALSNGFPTFSAGVATGTTFAWNDVGIINLTPVVASRNYLDVDVDPSDGVDVGDVIGTPQRVGRFIPSYLAVTPGAVTNRSATPACAASSFTYMGEPMTANFTLTAKAAGGATTQNYRGKFAKFDPAAAAASGQNGQLALAAVDAGTPRTPFSACGATPAHACI